MRIIGFMLLALTGLLVGCQSDRDVHVDQYQSESARQLLQEGDAALRGARYEKAEELYDAIATYAPLSEENRLALLHSIYAHYQQKDVEGVQAIADHFIQFYPLDHSVDYALYMKAMVLLDQRGSWLQKKVHIAPDRYDLQHLQQAYTALRDLQRRYPKSIYGKQSLYLLWELKYWLAHHELEVARFYWSRGAALSAANRATNAMAIDQRRAILEPSLAMLEQVYLKLDDKPLLKQVRAAKHRLNAT